MNESVAPQEKSFIDYPLSAHLRKYQKEICNTALNHGCYGIFSDTGTGKTIMGLEIAHHYNKTLILCPLSVIETALWFDKKEDEIAYLTSLLDAFTKYMEANNLPTDEPYKFWMSQPSILLEGETIPEVYTNFKIFVEGYKAVHKPTIVNANPKIQLL